MNFDNNEYLKDNLNSAVLIKYKIETEYNHLRDFLIVDKEYIENDSGVADETTAFDYSYGLLTNIYYSNVIVLDIDSLKQSYWLTKEDTGLNAFIKEYNQCQPSERNDLIIKTYKYILGSKLKRVEVYRSSTKRFITYHDPHILTNSRSEFDYKMKEANHFYLVLDDYYDVSNIYKHPITNLIVCQGFLKFLVNSSYVNIRITNKIQKQIDQTRDNTISLIQYREFSVGDYNENVSNRRWWDRFVLHSNSR